ncbi:MAG: divalent-cation tolerance protein CutA [Candidatus Omnitrophota bacterium]
MDYILIMVTCANKKEAEKISSHLLEQRLIACSNIVEHVNSIFHWEGSIDNASEALVIMKSRRNLFQDIKKTVKEQHSYDVPEIIAFQIVDGDEDYLNWVAKETSNG